MYNPTPNLPSNLYTAGVVRADTRQLAAMLYQEQRQREAEQARENKAIDDSLKKEIGKVRSADVPVVVSAFDEWKNINKKLLFDKRLQRDPKKFAEAQREAALAKQNYLNLTSESAALNENMKALAQDRFKNPNNYNDDFQNLYSIYSKTPINQLNKAQYNGSTIDLTSPDTYLYQGTNTDFSKILQNAIGTPKQTYSATRPMDDKGLQFEVTPYQYGNSPSQVKTNLIGAFAERRAGRDAAYLWDNLPKEEFESVSQKFKSIDPDRWRKMGVGVPQQIDSENPENKAENYASYLAMKYAIETEPKAQAPQFKINEARKMELENEQKRREDIFRSNLRKGEIQLRESIKNKVDDEQKNSVKGWLESSINNAIKGKAGVLTDKNGQSISVYDMPITPGLAKSFERMNEYGQKIQPDFLKVTKEGDIYPIYAKKEVVTDEKGNLQYTGKFKKKNGKIEFDEKLTTPVSVNDILPDITKEFLTPSKVEKSFYTEEQVDVEETLSKSPTDWKVEGDLYRYKDGRLFDKDGNVVNKK